MCEFISWYESGMKLYYLTDAEVFSEEGKLKLTGCKDNDILGHGAIKKFYEGMDGVQYEERDFWNDTLPKELADKVKEFDKHWGRMWTEGYFQNDDLCYIIEYAPDEWAAKAWKQLLKQNPSNYYLRYIVAYAPDKWKAKAWEQLLKQNPSNYDLRYIIKYAPGEWASKALEQLLKHNPSNNDLCYIIEYAPSEWASKAWEQLLKQNPSNDDLCNIVEFAPDEWASKARELFSLT
jgi:hypothetical protein